MCFLFFFMTVVRSVIIFPLYQAFCLYFFLLWYDSKDLVSLELEGVCLHSVVTEVNKWRFMPVVCQHLGLSPH